MRFLPSYNCIIFVLLISLVYVILFKTEIHEKHTSPYIESFRPAEPITPLKNNQCPSSIFHSLFPKNGKYVVKEYTATTKDNIALKIFRVNLAAAEKSKLKDQKNINTPILLVHGLIDSSDLWFENGEGRSIGYYFADKGFDVWLLNSRGNKYSHSTPSQKINSFGTEALMAAEEKASDYHTYTRFFDFSAQELATVDIPTAYELILKERLDKTKKIWMCGHSQGGQLLAISLIDPASSQYIKENTEKFIALAPAIFVSRNSEWMVVNFVLGRLTKMLWLVLDWFRFDEILRNGCSPDTDNKKWWAEKCENWPTVCNKVFGLFSGDAKFNNAAENPLKYFNHHPGGTSLRNLMHLIDMGFKNPNDFRMRKADNGYFQNVIEYGTVSPPAWDLKLLEGTPIIMYGGKDDVLVDMPAMNKLWKVIGGFEGNKWQVLTQWDHDTFIFGRKIERLFEQFDKDLF